MGWDGVFNQRTFHRGVEIAGPPGPLGHGHLRTDPRCVFEMIGCFGPAQFLEDRLKSEQTGPNDQHGFQLIQHVCFHNIWHIPCTSTFRMYIWQIEWSDMCNWAQDAFSPVIIRYQFQGKKKLNWFRFQGKKMKWWCKLYLKWPIAWKTYPKIEWIPIPRESVSSPALRLTASSTGHLCNENVFSRFIETNCVQWIQVHLLWTLNK